MKRKISILVLTFLCALLCACGIVACGGKTDGGDHTHTYSPQWTYDADSHWHKATCEHTTETKDKAEHSFNGDVCSVCSYDRGHEHSLTHEVAKLPDCTSDGNTEYWFCQGCGKYFSDGNAQTETSRDAVILSSAGHLFGAWALYDDCLCESSYGIRFCHNCDKYETMGEAGTIHPHSFVKVSAERATCTEPGILYWFKCENCDKEFKKTENALGHTVVFWTVEIKPSADKHGEQYGYCIRCAQKITESIHNWNDGEIIQALTCTQSELRTYTCTVCGATDTVTTKAARGHKYDDGKVLRAATCTENGSVQYTCDRCGTTKNDVIKALGHNYKWTVVKQANCYEKGLRRGVCSVCEDETESETDYEHDFDYENAKTLIEATCLTAGREQVVCKICKTVKEYSVNPLGHDYKVIRTEPASCETDGHSYYQCSRCGENRVQTINGLDHDTETLDEKPANCIESGYRVDRCKLCGVTERVILPRLDHDYEWKYDDNEHYKECSHCHITKEIDAHDFEYKVRSNEKETDHVITYYFTLVKECKACGYAKTLGKEVAHNHKEGNKILNEKKPTCTQSGLDFGLACSICDEVLVEQTVIPALWHKFTENACVRCGLKFSAGLEYQQQDDGYYTITGIGACTDTEINIPEHIGLPLTSIGDYAFSFKGCSRLTSITIPNSVTSIGKYAFSGCNSLTIYCEAASKPSGWNSNWNYSRCPVVWDCKNNDVATDGYAYTVIDGIRYGIKDGKATVVRQSSDISGAITVPSSIEYKGTNYSVSSIDKRAFDGCIGLTSITIPNGVTSIGEYAFLDCSGLKNITIPNSVTRIGKYAFSGCNSLTIYCEAINEPSDWNSTWNNSNCPVVWDCKNNKSEYTAYAVIDGIRYGFKNGKATVVIQSSNISGAITVPSSIEYKGTNYSVIGIGDHAFRYCTGLTSITIPNSVISIGNSAFRGCSSLTSVKLENGQQQEILKAAIQ